MMASMAEFNLDILGKMEIIVKVLKGYGKCVCKHFADFQQSFDEKFVNVHRTFGKDLM